MKLYYVPGSCALAPHIVLEWAGEHYQTVRMAPEDLRDHHFLDLNPMGAVPVFVDDEGNALSQTSAILLYLARKFDPINVGYGGTLHEHYELDCWLSFLSADLHKAFAPVFAPPRFHPDSDQHDTIRQHARLRIRQLFDIVNDLLDGRDHVIHDRQTIADAYLFVICSWAERVLEDGLNGWTSVKNFYEYTGNDEGVRAAMTQQGLR